MKKSSIILIALLMLITGFVLAWLIKPSGHQNTTVVQHQDHETHPATDQIWTCSMHPQIRQNEPGQCPICEMDLIPLEENTSNDPLVLQMTPEAAKLAEIQTTMVGEGGSSTGKTIRLTGKIKSDERLAASQVAHIPGRIEKLYVTFTGEQVNQGQKLADLYSPDLITAQRELLEALKLQEFSPGLVQAARQKLRYWKIPEATIQSIETNGTVQETFPIFADASGIVTRRRVAVGDYVKQGEALFELMNLSRVWVLFDAYEEDLASIKVGMPVEFTTPSLPGKTFSTRITFIDPVINPETRVASIRAEVNNAGGKLKPEMFVNGLLKNKAVAKSQLTVPKSAVLWTGKRSVVYVKVPELEIPSYQYREVELGEALGDHYQLLSGLEAGEEIVTNGNFTIDAAAQLNNQSSMINRMVSLKVPQTAGLPNYHSDTPEEFKMQLKGLVDTYLGLKDALVDSDPQAASAKAKEVNSQIDKIDMSLVSGAAHEFWMEQLKALKAHSNQISEIADLEKQRSQFDFLSQALIKTVQVFGLSEDTYYVQHCPMASDDQGADWLSREEEILNPYFGEKMLKCGFVKDTLAPE